MRFKKKKKTLADYFALSNKSAIISTFSLFLIVISLPITLFLLNQRTHYEEHAAGSDFPTINLTQTPVSLEKDTVPPIIYITSPVNGAQVKPGSTIAISVSVSDNDAVAKVEYLVDNRTICTLTAFPYACTWVVPGKSGVFYTITANGYDKAGNKGANSIMIPVPK